MFDKVICPFYSVGYCKFKDQCHKKLPTEECNNSLCQRKWCLKRHRKQCKCGLSYKLYKLDKSCEFLQLHTNVSNRTLEKVKEKLRESEEIVVKIDKK